MPPPPRPPIYPAVCLISTTQPNVFFFFFFFYFTFLLTGFQVLQKQTNTQMDIVEVIIAMYMTILDTM